MQVLIAQKGTPQILTVPDPVPSENEVLIETAFSAISPGTELAALSQQSTSLFSLLRRGIKSWDQLKKSLVRRGWRKTLAKVEDALEKPIPLGYSISGRIVQVGSAVDALNVGDWVVAVGPSANHGNLVSVPQFFCACIPKPELAQDACTAALACIGIHALHRAELSAGAEVGLFGLGAIGQFMAQVLRACGCRVIAFDPLETRRQDASLGGVETYNPNHFDFDQAFSISSHGQGFDAVFLCLKTDSSEVMHQAAALCRKHGRLIIVGEFPIQLPRQDGYEKELEVRISAAYGEGRYDPSYEHLDQDYPIASSRWTIQRNLQLFLRWLEEGKISLGSLRPRILPFSESLKAYEDSSPSASTLTLLQYEKVSSLPTLIHQNFPRSMAHSSILKVAVVGTGRFASETHLPHLNAVSDKFSTHMLVGRNPTKTAALAVKFQIPNSTCDIQKVYSDPDLSAILIATPHDQHANQAIGALKNGKHVYVEKPLCISLEDLERIEQAYQNSKSHSPVLFVGFNRRYAPLSQKLLEIRMENRQPLDIRYHFRAAPLPKGEWYHDPLQGGRIIGEACHAIDWILWLVGCPVKSQTVISGKQGEADIFFQFVDSSRAHLRFQPVLKNPEPKETVEVHQGSICQFIQDFLSLKIFDRDVLVSEDQWYSKGYRESLDAFATAITKQLDGSDPYGFFASSRKVLEIDQELRGVSHA